LYIIFKKKDNVVFAIENSKVATNLYDPNVFDFVHWCINLDGSPPKLGEVLVDKRTVEQKIASGEAIESPILYTVAMGKMVDGTIEATAKKAWLDNRGVLKAKYAAK